MTRWAALRDLLLTSCGMFLIVTQVIAPRPSDMLLAAGVAICAPAVFSWTSTLVAEARKESARIESWMAEAARDPVPLWVAQSKPCQHYNHVPVWTLPAEVDGIEVESRLVSRICLDCGEAIYEPWW